MKFGESYHGYVNSAQEALRLVLMSYQARIGRVSRRLTSNERKMIRPGSVFIYEERESGIKRWTDGRRWSPSRVQGPFLIYVEQANGSLHGTRWAYRGLLLRKTFRVSSGSLVTHVVAYEAYEGAKNCTTAMSESYSVLEQEDSPSFPLHESPCRYANALFQTHTCPSYLNYNHEYENRDAISHDLSNLNSLYEEIMQIERIDEMVMNEKAYLQTKSSDYISNDQFVLHNRGDTNSGLEDLGVEKYEDLVTF